MEASEGLAGGLLGGSGVALWRPGALFGCSGAALGRLWGAYGRLLTSSGPKWPPGWPQGAAKWGQEAPRGRHKAAKSWLLEPPNGPKRLQRAIKRGIRKQMPKTSKLMTLSMEMLDFWALKGVKISENQCQSEARSNKAAPGSNIEPQEAGK